MASFVRTRLRAVLREEGGWTLIELLAVMSIFAVILGASLSLAEVSDKIGRKDTERANALREQQAGVYRMVRELRQAYQILGTTPWSIEFLVRKTASESKHVRFSCGDDNPGKCMRYETAIGQPLPTTGELVVDRVLNWGQTYTDAAVFDFSDADAVTPAYVKIHLEVPAKGERTTGYANRAVLEDGFFARNMRIVGLQN
jgi:prepilin-type N-terminal cleavage/methylation domain-containing protein